MLYRNDELISKVLKHGQNIQKIGYFNVRLGNDQLICSRPSSIQSYLFLQVLEKRLEITSN